MLGLNIRKFAETLEKQGGIYAPSPASKILSKLSREELETFLELQQREAQIAKQRRKLQNVKKAVSVPSVCDFIENECIDAEKIKKLSKHKAEYDFSTAQGIVLAPHQRRILTHVLTIDARTGTFPYLTVVYSAPKKSGKTAISGFVGAYFAKYIETPNRVMVLANDRDQAHERAVNAMLPTLIRSGDAKAAGGNIYLDNGSEVLALTNQPESEAGGHYGLTLWTELWAFHSQRSLSLWAELMPIATRQFSMRWVDSYAGYEDKSALLLSLFFEIFEDTKETKLNPLARAVPELADITTTDGNGKEIPCCYERPDLGLFYYVDHDYRMSWQKSKTFFAKASLGLTETDINRLLHNRWQKTEDKFLTDEQLEGSFLRGVDLPPAVPPQMVLAIDASKSKANSGIVGVYEEERGGKQIFRTAYAKAYDPQKLKDIQGIDLEATIAADVVALYRNGQILKREPDAKEKKLVEEGYTPIEVHYDPYQFMQVAINLRKQHKILLREFDQKAERTKADTFLKNCYDSGTIDNLPSAKLKEHLANASRTMTTDGDSGEDEKLRITKSETSPHPNDLVVCQSMAVYRCANRPKRPAGFGSLGLGRAKGLV